jgi:hypothetical protein
VILISSFGNQNNFDQKREKGTVSETREKKGFIGK